MFCINILQPSLELEAKNLEFCFEDRFKKRAIVESRNFLAFKPDFSSGVNLFEEPSAYFLLILIQFLLMLILAQA
jgi:hypothetical protein